MRVAVVGGTGPFGKALAARLHASGIDVIVGSRDAERPLQLRSNSTAWARRTSRRRPMRTSSSSPSTPKRRSTPPASFGTRSERHPCLSVASELRFTKEGVFPSPDALSLAERVQAELAGPVVAGLHSLAASSLGADDPPDEDAFVCGDDPAAKASGSSSPVASPRVARSTPARSRAPARSKASRLSS